MGGKKAGSGLILALLLLAGLSCTGGQGQLSPASSDVSVPRPTPHPSPLPASAKNGKLAFISSVEGAPRVYVREPASEKVTRLSERTFSEYAARLAWSPNGRWLGLLSDAPVPDAGRRTLNLRLLDSGGHRERVVAATRDGQVLEFAWGPDSEQLAYVAGVAPDHKPHIYVADVRGRIQSRLIPTDIDGRLIEDLAWSPDGEHLAFVAEVDGRRQALSLDLDDPETASRSGSLRGAASPSWSPDGSTFSFLARAEDAAGHRLFTSRDGGEPEELLPADAYSWSPNGESIAFLGPRGLGSYDVGDSKITNLVSQKDIISFEWAPDSSAVSFTDPRGLFAVDVSTGKGRRLSLNPLDRLTLSWQPLTGQTPQVKLARSPIRPLPPHGSLRGACALTQARGDFDGDGKQDVIVVHSKMSRGRCTFDQERIRTPRRASVFLGSGQVVRKDLACSYREFRNYRITEGCAAESAPDLDGDGKDEITLNVGGGSAHADSVAFYSLTGERLERIGIAPAGAPDRYLRPRSVEFQTAGSASSPSGLFCRKEGGDTRLVYFHGRYLGRGKERVSQDLFTFDGTNLNYLRTESYVRKHDLPLGPPHFCGYRFPRQ